MAENKIKSSKMSVYDCYTPLELKGSKVNDCITIIGNVNTCIFAKPLWNKGKLTTSELFVNESYPALNRRIDIIII